MSWRVAGTRRDGTHVDSPTHFTMSMYVFRHGPALDCFCVCLFFPQTEAHARPDGGTTEMCDAGNASSISVKVTWAGEGQGAREERRRETGCRSGALMKRRERWAPSIHPEHSCVSR